MSGFLDGWMGGGETTPDVVADKGFEMPVFS